MQATAQKVNPGEISGNRKTSFFKRPSPGAFFFQAKLTIGPTDDVYEREADAVADKVMRMTDHEKIQTKISPVEIQRKCSHCEEEELQRKESGSDHAETEVPSSVNDVISSAGRPLDKEPQSFMENRFGYDFSNVKVHTDTIAAKSAQTINALAYTSGNNIVFNEGQYSPGTEKGKKLLAHELTHVVQQTGNSGLVSRQEDESEEPMTEPNFTTGADPCTYRGRADREREIHLNLGLRAVRVYTGRTSFREFGGLIIGPRTYELARANRWCHMYPVAGKQRVSGLGLINFVNYCDDFGFHSNFWRQTRDGKRVTERIPGSESHGCARLNDSNAASTASSESNAFYDMVSENDCVRIYERNNWRPPTFKRCSGGADCSP